jgi:hypothetical protein
MRAWLMCGRLQAEAKRRWSSCGSSASWRGELRQAGRERVHTAANASNLPADGHNKPAVHMMKVAGLAIILG